MTQEGKISDLVAMVADLRTRNKALVWALRCIKTIPFAEDQYSTTLATNALLAEDDAMAAQIALAAEQAEVREPK